MKLLIEYFDTDASSYKHRLEIPMKAATYKVATSTRILHVVDAQGVERHIPLDNVKQYYIAG